MTIGKLAEIANMIVKEYGADCNVYFETENIDSPYNNRLKEVEISDDGSLILKNYITE